jgi:ribosomal protein S14
MGIFIFVFLISMKKIKIKDKKARFNVKYLETQKFISKTLFNNTNFLNLLRWNSLLNLKNISLHNSKTRLSNRCILTINKKRSNKLTNYSRMVFLKQIRSGNINGIQKACW